MKDFFANSKSEELLLKWSNEMWQPHDPLDFFYLIYFKHWRTRPPFDHMWFVILSFSCLIRQLLLGQWLLHSVRACGIGPYKQTIIELTYLSLMLQLRQRLRELRLWHFLTTSITVSLLSSEMCRRSRTFRFRSYVKKTSKNIYDSWQCCPLKFNKIT